MLLSVRNSEEEKLIKQMSSETHEYRVLNPSFDIYVYAVGSEIVHICGRDRDKSGNVVYELPDTKRERVATLKDSVLFTDMPKICKDFSNDRTTRDTVLRLYQSDIRDTEYDGVEIRMLPQRYEKLWGPSNDTIFFADGIRFSPLAGIDVLSDDVKDAIEIGCGSGFIGKYITTKCKNIKNITFLDINPFAKQCVKNNTKELGKQTKINIKIKDAVEYLESSGKKFDIIALNPPYVPRMDNHEFTPYQGQELFSYMIKNADKLLKDGGKMVTNISSMSLNRAEKSIGAAKKKGLKYTHISKMAVPFKVAAVQRNTEWIEYLKKINAFIKQEGTDYDYWHQLNLFAVSKE
ncbi:MAG: methyltransferase [Candidatus Aenigmarchaeota archaeon]|nr:methyltransferase [Candidatus Aenigmarchaeota archaeon]